MLQSTIHLTQAIIIFLSLTQSTRAALEILTENGQGNLKGWNGVIYQAIRWEPLCGNLGNDGYYNNVYDYTSSCVPAMERFLKTEDLLAYYDETGIKKEGQDALVGGDSNVCMCFALKQVAEGGQTGAFCVWLNTLGQTDIGSWVNCNYRPSVGKALPLCGGDGFDLAEAKADWSRTAVQPQSTATVIETETSGPNEPDTTTLSRTTFVTPSVITLTTIQSSLYTSTLSDGSFETGTAIVTTEVPIVTIYTAPLPSSDSQPGLTTGDKIGLGVGLGLGLPILALLIIIAITRIRRPRGGPGVHPPQYQPYNGWDSGQKERGVNVNINGRHGPMV